MQTLRTKQTNRQMHAAHFSVISASASALFASDNINNDLMTRYVSPKSPSDATPELNENDVMNPADLGTDEGAIDVGDGSTKAGSQDTPPSKP